MTPEYPGLINAICNTAKVLEYQGREWNSTYPNYDDWMRTASASCVCGCYRLSRGIGSVLPWPGMSPCN